VRARCASGAALRRAAQLFRTHPHRAPGRQNVAS
jgi:hypothetical protein